MATREKRLAQFDGEGEPPPDLPVQVLCEDQSGTYELPFACRFSNGAWRNHESGGLLEANVIGWRMRGEDRNGPRPVSKCDVETVRR